MDKKQTEIKYLELYVKELEQKMGWGSKYEWTNYNFKKINEGILEKTGISISVSSIRRVLGLDKSYKTRFKPQLETKNALAKYLDYENWADFKNKKKKNAIPIHFKSIYLYILLALFLFGSIGFYFLISLNKNNPVYFKVKHKNGYSPHTIAVHYDLSQTSGKSFYIDFGEMYNNRNRTFLSKHEHIITHTYYNSYFYKIRLLNKDKTVTFDNVLVKSKGWDGGVIYNNEYYKFDSSEVNKEKGQIRISPKMLHAFGIDTTKNYTTEFIKSSDFKFGLNNTLINVSAKAIPNGINNDCSTIRLRFLCENELIDYTISNKGCESLSSLKAGNIKLDGKYKKLDKLTCNIYNFNEYRLITTGDSLIIKINNNEIFKTNPPVRTGKLRVIHIEFKGNGVINEVKILNNETEQILYNEKFK